MGETLINSVSSSGASQVYTQHTASPAKYIFIFLYIYFLYFYTFIYFIIVSGGALQVYTQPDRLLFKTALCSISWSQSREDLSLKVSPKNLNSDDKGWGGAADIRGGSWIRRMLPAEQFALH